MRDAVIQLPLDVEARRKAVKAIVACGVKIVAIKEKSMQCLLRGTHEQLNTLRYHMNK